jgi:hypothetical protein
VDLGPAVLLGLMWVVVNAIRKAGRTPPGKGGPPERPRSPSIPRSRTPGSSTPPSRAPGPATTVRRPPATAGGDPTQREGLRLEELLRELGRTLDQASGPAGRPPDRRLPSAEEQEETGSLEVTPEVRSLETTGGRPERAVVDQDDEAEQVIARRLKAAAANSEGLTRADHMKFDSRIREEPADKTATTGYTARQLRNAVVWREILGPPVSMRGEEEGERLG